MSSFIKKNVLPAIFFLGLLFLYRSWFLSTDIIGGDWPYFYPSMLSDFKGFVPLWSSQVGTGFGGINFNASLYSYLHGTIFFGVNVLHLPWQVVYKTLWFGLFLFLAFFSFLSLLKHIAGKKLPILGICTGAFLYTTNTYILMVVAGGQMGIALAYAILPLVVERFLLLLETPSPLEKKYSSQLKAAIIFGITFSLLAFFDLRIAFLLVVVFTALAFYWYLLVRKFSPKSFFSTIFISICITFLLHIYWILPFIFYKVGVTPGTLSSTSGFTFFSFADFSHAFSLLHPNWPENIFGKTSFLKPEFLLIPFAAFLGLFFSHGDKKKLQPFKLLFFFSLLSLVAVFFAKGANQPFSQINIWVFEHVPGMGVFRDATKFYFFIAFSYSLLIPLSLLLFYQFLERRKKVSNNFLHGLFIVLLLGWLLLIHPFVLGKLSGTFDDKAVPKQYHYLEKLINNNPSFFRTLWLPEQTRYRVLSEQHPLINGTVYFQTTSGSKILSQFSKKETEQKLNNAGVRYVIIPYDATKEMFLKDRKYNDQLRLQYVRALDKIPWLRKIYDNQLTVYENKGARDHAYFSKKGEVTSIRKDNTHYIFAVSSTEKQSFIITEAYNPGWKATLDNKSPLVVSKTSDGVMEVVVPKGLYKIDLVYSPQRTYAALQLFSLGFFGFLLVALYYLRPRK